MGIRGRLSLDVGHFDLLPELHSLDGLPIAVAPAVVLALAEYGLDRALLVIAGVVVINVVAENLLSPMLIGRD